MNRIALSLSGLLAVVMACSAPQDEPASSDVTMNPVYSEPLVDPWSDEPEIDTGGAPAVSEATEVVEPVQVAAPEEAESEALPAGRWFTLRRGESPAHYARWSGLPVEEITRLSGLELGDTFQVGTDLFVPVTGEALADVEKARSEHRTRRVDGYLASRGGSVGNDFYEVRTGDTAWDIARASQDIPVWLLESYNPSVDLDRLRPGDELMVPVLADTVADARMVDIEQAETESAAVDELVLPIDVSE